MHEFDLKMTENEGILSKAIGDDYTITTNEDGNQIIKKKEDV